MPDTVRLHHVIDGDTGPVVMLGASLGTDLSLWDDLAADLARDHRVVRFDTRGHGRSPAPEGGYTRRGPRRRRGRPRGRARGRPVRLCRAVARRRDRPAAGARAPPAADLAGAGLHRTCSGSPPPGRDRAALVQRRRRPSRWSSRPSPAGSPPRLRRREPRYGRVGAPDMFSGHAAAQGYAALLRGAGRRTTSPTGSRPGSPVPHPGRSRCRGPPRHPAGGRGGRWSPAIRDADLVVIEGVPPTSPTSPSPAEFRSAVREPPRGHLGLTPPLSSVPEDAPVRVSVRSSGGMRKSRLRLGALAMSVITVATGLVGCGAGGDAPSDFCKSVDALAAAVKQINRRDVAHQVVRRRGRGVPGHRGPGGGEPVELRRFGVRGRGQRRRGRHHGARPQRRGRGRQPRAREDDRGPDVDERPHGCRARPGQGHLGQLLTARGSGYAQLYSTR